MTKDKKNKLDRMFNFSIFLGQIHKNDNNLDFFLSKIIESTKN